MRGEVDALAGLVVVGLVLFLWFWKPRWRPDRAAYGTATLATDADCLRAGMARGQLVLGTSLESGNLLRLPESVVHLSLIAPTGAGKGVSYLVPWLLAYTRGSCVVLDPKGELFGLTAKHRSRLGQKVVRLDPFSVCGPGDRWNVLDLIPPGPDVADEARPLANAMVVRPPEEGEGAHWNDRAEDVITALLVYILTFAEGDQRNLCGIRDALTVPGATDHVTGRMLAAGGITARLGGVLRGLSGDERASVLSTVSRHTSFLDSLAVGAATSASSFDMRALLDGDTTVYLVLPPHQLAAQARWLRLVISSIIRMIGKEGMRNGRQCLMVLDEAGTALGADLPAVEQGLTLLRSFGLRMFMAWQSVGQIRTVFRGGKEGVVLENCAQLYWGVNSLETAEAVSKRLGNYTRVISAWSESESRSRQEDGLGTPGVNVSRTGGLNWSVITRELFRPEEVMAAPPEAVFAFLPGVPPVICRRVKWFEHEVFRRRAGR